MLASVRSWFADWLEDVRRFSLASRAAAVAVLALWVFQAYQLGWTRHLIGTVGGESAWGERDRYAALGFASMQHLSAINVARSVMFLPLLALIVYAVARPARIHRQGMHARCVLLAALAALGVYSFIVKDVPFNFYGSRYFLPMVVPLVMMAFGLVLCSWKQSVALVVALAVIAAGGYHTYGLMSAPAYQNGISLQAAIAHRASKSDVTFLIGRRPMQKILQAGVMAMSGARVIFIDTARVRDGRELQELVDGYMIALNAEEAILVSERAQPFVSPQERLEAQTSSIPFAIAYNTYQRQATTYRYYIGTYRDQSTVVSNARPEWIVGGTLSVPVVVPSGRRQVLVRTGGGWLWASRKAGVAPSIELLINGEPARLLSQHGSDFRFAVPADRSAGARLEIRTNTFVPADIGINADRRSLGADLVSVRFEDTDEPHAAGE